jgi:hypothetical protein
VRVYGVGPPQGTAVSSDLAGLQAIEGDSMKEDRIKTIHFATRDIVLIECVVKRSKGKTVDHKEADKGVTKENERVLLGFRRSYASG